MNAQIHTHLAGRTIAGAFEDGERLILETECGHRVRIVWRLDPETGQGGPVLEGVDVRIVLPETESYGAASTL